MANSINTVSADAPINRNLFGSPFKNKFYYFLWWCAGSDIQKLEKSPSDYEKHISLGVFVLFTGIFAFIAMSYALSYVFLSSGI